MRRDIKFRAKEVNTNKWVFGDLHLIANFPHIHSEYYDKHLIYPDTIGQYTGLNDKNGKEIYSGDILKTFTGSKCEVVYHEASFKIRYNKRHEPNILTRSSVLVLDYEVIGNIYDNPELLEE